MLETESASLDEWLWQLRTAIEKSYDAIDDVEFYWLEKVRQQNVKAFSPFSKLGIGSSVSKKIDSSRQSLSTVIKTLDLVAAGVGNFISIIDCLKGYADNHLARETGRLLPIDNVLGRSDEMDKLVVWLTTSQSAHETVVAVVIVAQLVYNDERVKNHTFPIGLQL